MKKKFSILLAAALTLSMLLTGCKNAKPLPEGMDQDEVADAAQAIVELLLDEEYQAVADIFRPELKAQYNITADSIEALMDTVEDAGAFVKMEETLVLGGKSKDFSEPYAAVAVYCEHENEDIVYEMSLDMDLALLGLAAKQK
jgi:hypothetical protein